MKWFSLVFDMVWWLLLIISVLCFIEHGYVRKLNKWEQERFQLLQEIFQIATTLVYSSSGKIFKVSGGLAYHQDTALNYQTLVSMLELHNQTELGRIAVLEGLRKAISNVADFEKNNPQPKPPKIRIPF